MNIPPVAVLCGGVGAARFLRGLIDAVDVADSITAVVNTGDDSVLHGLSISPDLDTIIYTLADAIDPERGWGLVDETWRAIESLERYETVRPDGSAAAPRWFNLGDRDLATHFYRTARLGRRGDPHRRHRRDPTAWGVAIRVLPMSDHRLSTFVSVTDDDGTTEEVSFQDYFVRLRHGVPVTSVRFDGTAELSEPPVETLGRRDVGGDRTIESTGVDRPDPSARRCGPTCSSSRRDRVAAISPIVGGAALKGPADRMLTELGHEPSVVGVARLYAPIASVLVIDAVDAHHAAAVEATGMRCVVTDTVMSTPTIARRLALDTLASLP